MAVGVKTPMITIPARDMSLIVVAASMPAGHKRDDLIADLSCWASMKVWLEFDKDSNLSPRFHGRRRVEHLQKGLCDFGTGTEGDGLCMEKATWQVAMWQLCAAHAKICCGKAPSKDKRNRRIRK